MTPGTLNTILNTAPMIIQGASKLIKLIRDRESEADLEKDNDVTSLEDLRQEIARIESRLNENSHSDVEQIRLIEQLARQNEALAETLRQSLRRLTVLNYIALLALAGSVSALAFVLYG
jgi:hypothetical protein